MSITAISMGISPAAGAGAELHADPCRENFTVRGGTMSGFTVATFSDFSGLKPGQAFQRVARVLGESGTIQSANESLGTLSALGALRPETGVANPVNAVVRSEPPYVRIRLSWSVPAFTVFHRADVERRFCDWLESISSLRP
jgi:hypothetical protein